MLSQGYTQDYTDDLTLTELPVGLRLRPRSEDWAAAERKAEACS